MMDFNIFVFPSKKRRDKYAATKVEKEVTAAAMNETPPPKLSNSMHKLNSNVS